MNRFDSAQSLLTLMLVSLACLVVLVIATGYVLMRQDAATERLNRAIDLHDRSCRLADQLRQSSDDLTRMVRTYAVTGDSTFEEYFYTILRIRDGKAPRPEHYDRIFWDFKAAGEAMPGSQDRKRVSLRRLMEDAGFADEEFELLAEAQRRSDQLVQLEETAMNAMKGQFRDATGAFTVLKAPDRELALQILFGKEYHQAKSEIMRPMHEFLIASDTRTAGVLAKVQQEHRSLSIALVCLLCCLLMVSPVFAFAGYRYHRVTYAELRYSEGRFLATFEQAAVGIAHMSPDGYFLRSNDRFCEIVGYSQDEMPALTYQDITHPDDLTADVGEVQRLLRGEADTYSMEKRYVHKDGETVWVNLTVSLLRNDAGEPRWFVSVVEDISERKQVATELARSESKFRRLNDANVVGIFFWNTAGDITEANDEFLRMVGYTREEVVSGKVCWKDMTPPEHAAADEKALEEVVATGITKNLEKEYFRKDGSRVPVVLGAAVLEGSQDAGICYVQDLSERKRAEEALRKSEQRFRGIMEQSPLGIEILTPEGQINQVNPAWLQLWGITEEDAAQVLAEYNMLRDDQLVELGIAQLVENAFAGQQVVLPPIHYVGERTMEDVGVAKSKAKAPWIQCHLFPVKNSSGEITNVINTYMDITEQKQAEESLKAHRERLRALALELTLSEERERRRIATELHDGAAQSLAFARMQLASACKAVGESDAAKKLDEVSQILRESLGQIREVLLDLSSPSMNEIGLGEAISEWLEQQIGRRHGLKTSFTDECGKVPLDDDVRAVLFRNSRELLTNVVKHAQAKTVAVHMESTGDALRITIEDDGRGLDPEDATGTLASGFGLFSIRERMLDLGGSLEIVSAPGEGCEATLVMPLAGG